MFISYRREGGAETARLVHDWLEARGWRAFLDVADLGASYFDDRILLEIQRAEHFVVVLSPGSLDRCRDKADWVRREVLHARATGRNIVPLAKAGFAFPDLPGLPDGVRELRRYNVVEYSHTYFDAAMGRLESFLRGPAGPG